MTFATFAELPDSIGSVTAGVPFVVSTADDDAFAKATHLDEDYPDDPADYPPDLVAGFHLLGMVDTAARLANPAAGETMWGLNYGLDRVRFIKQVHFGQRVLSSFETLAVEPKDKGYKVLRRCVLTLEGDDSPAMVADWWSFVLPRGVVDPTRRADTA